MTSYYLNQFGPYLMPYGLTGSQNQDQITGVISVSDKNIFLLTKKKTVNMIISIFEGVPATNDVKVAKGHHVANKMWQC